MADFRLTYTDCALLQSQITAFGPSRFARCMAGGDAGGDPGGDFDGGHGVNTATWLWSFDNIITPSVASSNPTWSQDQIHAQALRIFNLRIGENARIFRDEEENVDDMDTIWEISEVDGARQLVVKHGEYKGTTLNDFWEHTRQFAEEKNSPEAYNPAEHQAQLSMQKSLVNGTAKGAITILSHPEDIKYVQVWEAQMDGTIVTRQIDLKNTTGRHLTHEEGESFIEKMAEKYTRYENKDTETSKYVHVITTEKIDVREVRIMAKAHVAVSPTQPDRQQDRAQQRETNNYSTSMRRLPHVDERLGEATYDTISFVTRRVVSDGILAFDQMKKMVDRERMKKKQEEFDRIKLKKVRTFLGLRNGAIKKDMVSDLEEKSNDVQNKKERKNSRVSTPIQTGLRFVTALTLIRYGAKGALPVVAIALVAQEFYRVPTIKKEKSNFRNHTKLLEQKKVFKAKFHESSTKTIYPRMDRKKEGAFSVKALEKRREIFILRRRGKKFKKPEDTLVSRESKHSDSFKKLVYVAKAIQRIVNLERINIHRKEKRIAYGLNINKRHKTKEKAFYAKKEQTKRTEKKHKNLREIRTVFEYMFLVQIFLFISRLRRISIVIQEQKKVTSSEKNFMSPRQGQKKLLEEDQGSLLIAIIWYLDMMKEQGQYGKQQQAPAGVQTSHKSGKKKNQIRTKLLPQRGIIFAYPS